MIYLKYILKVIKNIYFCLVIFTITPMTLLAQEFNCTVEVRIDQLEGSSFDYLENLKPVLENYINEYKWTEKDFEEEERINCQ
ncbi:MAG: DUF4835 family protein, partial [Balneolaceae bacterium]